MFGHKAGQKDRQASSRIAAKDFNEETAGFSIHPAEQLRDSAPSDKVDTEPVIMLEKMGVSDFE
jgi:hypothetical protein